MQIPTSWETRFSGKQHLVFESDFEPTLQIRWEKVEHPNAKQLRKKLSQFTKQSSNISTRQDISSQWKGLENKFGFLLLAQGIDNQVNSGICGCTHCKQLFYFQIHGKDPLLAMQAANCLSTIECHGHKDSLWRVQDISLQISNDFQLTDYTFAAGLTRLSFQNSHLTLHSCKLGPADKRLGNQSLPEILKTLVGTDELHFIPDQSGHSQTALRSPPIWQQVRYRLRRQQPFIHAKIYHDVVHNRLLAVVLLSNRPIAEKIAENIYQNYEIIQA